MEDMVDIMVVLDTMVDMEESDILESEKLKPRQNLKLKLIPMFCMEDIEDLEDMVDIMVVLDTMVDMEESDILESEKQKPRQSLKLKLIPTFCMVDMEDLDTLEDMVDTMVDILDMDGLSMVRNEDYIRSTQQPKAFSSLISSIELLQLSFLLYSIKVYLLCYIY